MSTPREMPIVMRDEGTEDRCCIPFEHEIDLLICDDLEALADELPRLPNGAAMRRLSERLSLASDRWRSQHDSPCRRISQLSRDFRLLDSIHAIDVSDAFWAYWRKPDPQAAECLGYMLRSLFDGRRRAIALERLELGCASCQSSAID